MKLNVVQLHNERFVWFETCMNAFNQLVSLHLVYTFVNGNENMIFL